MMQPSTHPIRHLEPRDAGNTLYTRTIPREVRAAVLLNAHAKRVNHHVRTELASVLPEEDIYFAENLADARAQAECVLHRRYDAVLVGGGDGTLTTTMNLLLDALDSTAKGGTRHALPDIGILPLGTGNGLANLTKAGHYLRDAGMVAEGLRPERVPLRLIRDKSSGWRFPFASIGYDAQVLNDYVRVGERAKSTWAKTLAKSLPGYMYAIATRTIPTEMRAKPVTVRIQARGACSMIDPETREEVALERSAVLFEGPARAVLAGTAPFYGFGLCALPFARRRTDRFHLRVSTAPIAHLLGNLPSMWKGTLRSPHLYDFLCEGVTVETSSPLPLQMAGDARGETTGLDLDLSETTFRLLSGSAAS
ncbi:MAG: hypothetical protein H6729_06230 [Deltaproteobacteria bacterium]|nr:hypothetical protein [Deltaproteobacteria bacterium]